MRSEVWCRWMRERFVKGQERKKSCQESGRVQSYMSEVTGRALFYIGKATLEMGSSATPAEPGLRSVVSGCGCGCDEMR